MALGKRKASEAGLVNDDRRYNKRHRKSDSSITPSRTHKSKNCSTESVDPKKNRDRGYYSSRLSHPACWTPKTHKNQCSCHRHSDSGFYTKSVRSPDRKRKSHCRRKVVKEDEEGHLVYQEGDVILNRYKLLRTIGQGTFGKVVAAYDLDKNEKKVAIKIVRKDQSDYEDAVLEAKILEDLKRMNTDTESYCIKILDWFDYHGHLCIVSEMLGHSVYEFMRRNNFQPFHIKDVQKISYKLCKAVKFCHDQKLAHTDLKPENMLFVDSRFDFREGGSSSQRGSFRQIKDCSVRLIDFGSAVFEDEHGKGLVSTRHYRAPEVILDLGWSFPCDVWSVGCIIFEIYSGTTLFQTHDAMEHLAMMERVLGMVPASMVEKSDKTKYFRKGKLDWDENSKAGKKVKRMCRPLQAYRHERSHKHRQLFDLMEKMLEYCPEKRITLNEALDHPFFKE